jgi:WD40 repeat protein
MGATRFGDGQYSSQLSLIEKWRLQGRWRIGRWKVSRLGGNDNYLAPDTEQNGKILALIRQRQRLEAARPLEDTVVVGSADFQPVSFMKEGATQSRSVCRIAREFSLSEFRDFIEDIQHQDDIRSFNSIVKLVDIFSIPDQITKDIFFDIQNRVLKNPIIVDLPSTIKLGISQYVSSLDASLLDDLQEYGSLELLQKKFDNNYEVAEAVFRLGYLEALKAIDASILAKLNPLPVGTGFLVGGNHILTNQHVIPDITVAEQCLAQFSYVQDARGYTQASIDYGLSPRDLFISNPDLDYTLVQLNTGRFTKQAGYEFGWIDLVEDEQNIAPGWFVMDSRVISTPIDSVKAKIEQYIKQSSILRKKTKKSLVSPDDAQIDKILEELNQDTQVHIQKVGTDWIALIYHPFLTPTELEDLLIGNHAELADLLTPPGAEPTRTMRQQVASIVPFKRRMGDRVFIIQHPRGQEQQIVLSDNNVLTNGLYHNFLRYRADSDYGSSGSPVFNEKWQLIALHHAAIGDLTLEDVTVETPSITSPASPASVSTSPSQVYAQQGVRICRILQDLKQKSLNNSKLRNFIDDFAVTTEQLHYPPLPAALEFDGQRSYVAVDAEVALTFAGTTQENEITIAQWSKGGLLLSQLQMAGIAQQESQSQVWLSEDGQLVAKLGQNHAIDLIKPTGQLHKSLSGHTEKVTSISFSHQQGLIASGSKDRAVRLWNSADNTSKILQAHQDSLTSISFSPRDELLATGSEDQTVRLWDISGQLLKTLRTSEPVLDLIWVGDQQTQNYWLLAKTRSGKLLQWTIKANQSERSWDISAVNEQPTSSQHSVDEASGFEQQDTIHAGEVFFVGFSPDGKTLVSASEKSLKLWTRKGRLKANILCNHLSFTAIPKFSANNQVIAVVDQQKLKLWDLKGKFLQDFEHHLKEPSDQSFAFAPFQDLKASITLAAISQPNKIEIRELALLQGSSLQVISQKSLAELISSNPLSDEEYYTHICFSPDGRILATIHNTFIQDYDLELTRESALAQPRRSNTVYVAKNDAYYEFLILDRSGEVILYNTSKSDENIYYKFVPDETLVNELNRAFENTPDELTKRQLVRKITSSIRVFRRVVTLWDWKGTQNWREMRKQSMIDCRAIKEFRFSPDQENPLLAVVPEFSTRYYFWKWLNRDELEQFRSPSTSHSMMWNFRITFSLDGQKVALIDDSNLVVLSTQNQQVLGHLKEGGSSIGFSSDGQKVAFSSSPEDQTWRDFVTLWSWQNQNIQVLAGNLQPKPDELAVWEPKRNEVGVGHQDKINSLCFSPDSDPDRQLLASASRDGTIKLWDYQGNLLKTLGGSISQIVNTPNGQSTFAGGKDGLIRQLSREGREGTARKFKLLSGVENEAENFCLAAISIDADIDNAAKRTKHLIASVGINGKVDLFQLDREDEAANLSSLNGVFLPFANCQYTSGYLKFNSQHSNLQDISNLYSFGGNKSFTLEAWVYPAADGSGGSIISKWRKDGEGEYNLKLSVDGTVIFSRLSQDKSSIYELKSGRPLPVGQFSHVAAIYNGEFRNMRLYINGYLLSDNSQALEWGDSLYINGDEKNAIYIFQSKVWPESVTATATNITIQQYTNQKKFDSAGSKRSSVYLIETQLKLEPNGIVIEGSKTTIQLRRGQPFKAKDGRFYEIDKIIMQDAKATIFFYDSIFVESQHENKIISVLIGACLGDPTLPQHSEGALTDFFKGSIAEVRIWDTARSQQEIQQNLSRRLQGDEPNLVGYWRFEEGDGDRIHNLARQNTTASAAFGKAFNANWVNASQYPALPIPFSLKFNGEDAYVDCGDVPQLSEAITVEAWVKHSFGDGLIVHRGGGWEENGYSLFWYRGKIRVELQDTSRNVKLTIDTQENAPSDNTWHHIAFTWTENLLDEQGNPKQDKQGNLKKIQEVEVYIDGRRQNVVAVSGESKSILSGGLYKSVGIFKGQIGHQKVPLTIGGLAEKEANGKKTSVIFFDGAIAEVRLWKVARTQNEIKANLYRRLNVAQESNLVGYWRLDEEITGRFSRNAALVQAESSTFDLNSSTDSAAVMVRDLTSNNFHGAVRRAHWFPTLGEISSDALALTSPPVSQPPTNQPPTNQPPTNQPPTNQPPTSQPPTNQPPTNQPPTSQLPTPQFEDLKTHWAKDKILELASRGIVKGYPDRTFQPDTPMNRAEFTALLVKAFNPVPQSVPGNFSDVPANFWAQPAIQQVYASGLMIGIRGNQFGPNLNLTRLQAVIVVVNCLIKQQKPLPQADRTLLPSFTDIGTLQPIAQDGIAIAVQLGIVARPSTSTQFRPYAAATRAEVAVMVLQALSI